MAKTENTAKVENKKETTSTATQKDTTKKAFVKRTNDELKKTEKGKIIVILRSAMSLANNKERVDLKSIEGKDKEGAKQLAGRMNLVLREGGKLTLMDDKSEEYNKLKTLATKALAELQKSNYGVNVKALLNYVLENLSVGSGKRGFNPASLQDISL